MQFLRYSVVITVLLYNIIKGDLNKEVNFSYGDRAKPSNSCGVTFKNEHYLFGGNWQFNRQVHKIRKKTIFS